MIANSNVRPKVALVATLCLGLLAMTFFCLPVRAEKKEPTTSKEQRESLKEKVTQAVDEGNLVLVVKPDAAEAEKKTQTKDAAAKPNEEELKTLSRDHIKTIMLAMHIYHDKHGSFPPAVKPG